MQEVFNCVYPFEQFFTQVVFCKRYPFSQDKQDEVLHCKQFEKSQREHL